MKCLWLLFIPALAFGQSQEILRPTVDIDGGSSLSNVLDLADCGSAVYNTGTAQPNWYDNGGISTSSTFSLTNASTSSTRCSGRVFKTWAPTTNTYTALSLNINASGVCTGNCGTGTISYTANGGGIWTQVVQSTTFAQQTFTITLSASQDLTKLQVAINDFANFNDVGGTGQGNMSLTGFDVWTVGTFTPVVPVTPQPPPPIVAISPIIMSKLMRFSQIAITAEML